MSDLEDLGDNFSAMTNEQLNTLFAAFTPMELMLETLYTPFLQDFQPSIGDVDTFVKPGRPDGKQDPLGLVVFDEPCVNQSDPTVLMLQLSNTIKVVRKPKAEPGKPKPQKPKVSVDQRIRVIEQDKALIEDWVGKIAKVHASQGDPEITYDIPVPSDTILELWDTEMEQALQSFDIPRPKIDLTVAEYAKICCLLLDIPMRDEKQIQSLHMYFMNYRDVLDETEIIKQQQQGAYMK